MSIETEVKGNWHEIKGIIKRKWAEITDDEIGVIDGKREKLIGSLIKKFNMTEAEAESHVEKFWPKA